MILHLVRHPRPQVAPETCYGRLDVPAVDVAATAASLRERLPAGLPVWSSPLRRCLALAECLHPQPRIDPRLAEIDFGDWEGKTWREIGAAPLDLWAADVAGFAPPGGESARALQARALAFVADLPADDAVLVTHAGVMRVLVAHWLGLEPAGWLKVRPPFGGLVRVRLAAGGAEILDPLSV